MTPEEMQEALAKAVQNCLAKASRQAAGIGSGYVLGRYVGLKVAENGTVTAEFELEIPHGT